VPAGFAREGFAEYEGKTLKAWALFLTLFVWQSAAMAIEEAKFTVIERDGQCELRQYESHIVAETIVTGDFANAGNQAFSRLFRYISGNNQSRQSIAMTGTVGQAAHAEKIAMTAPVGQERVGNGWSITFILPAAFTLETLPEPTDATVKLRQVTGKRMASISYSGGWTRKLYDEHAQQLRAWIAKKELKITGEEVWARYDPPFMPSFFRRNEVLIPVESNK